MRRETMLKPFHTKCKYTGMMLCTCTHGNSKLASAKGKHASHPFETLVLRSFTASARETYRPAFHPLHRRSAEITAFKQHAQKLWKLHNGGNLCQPDLLLRGMYCDVAIPPLKPGFPLSDAKRTQGWTEGELRQRLGDDRASILFRNRERVTVEDAKKILLQSKAALEGLEAKSEKLREVAEQFQQQAEIELGRHKEEKVGAEEPNDKAGPSQSPQAAATDGDQQASAKESPQGDARLEDPTPREEPAPEREPEPEPVPVPKRKRSSFTRKPRKDCEPLVISQAAPEDESGPPQERDAQGAGAGASRDAEAGGDAGATGAAENQRDEGTEEGEAKPKETTAEGEMNDAQIALALHQELNAKRARNV